MHLLESARPRAATALIAAFALVAMAGCNRNPPPADTSSAPATGTATTTPGYDSPASDAASAIPTMPPASAASQ